MHRAALPGSRTTQKRRPKFRETRNAQSANASPKLLFLSSVHTTARRARCDSVALRHRIACMSWDDPRRWMGPRATGPKGFLGWHGAMRPEGEVRVVLQQKRKELAKVQALLQVRKAEREVAVQLRDKAFSAEMMKYRSNHASVGLTFGNVDELRALKFEPPPIVQLVMRCVCTLVSGDIVGDAEALEAAEAARRPHSARSSSTVRGAHSLQGRIEAARELMAKASVNSKQPAVRRSDVRRSGTSSASSAGGSGNALLTWKASLQLLARPDFKWRMMNLNGNTLLDNTDLVDCVRSCLDLSSLAPDIHYAILPGRSHPGDRDEVRRTRRELTSALYSLYAETGVSTRSKLQFEEARYTSEVAGAMIIWIQRIFVQHDELRDLWEQHEAAIIAAEACVRPVKRRVDELEDALEELGEEYKAACKTTQRNKEKMMGIVAKPSARTRARPVSV